MAKNISWLDTLAEAAMSVEVLEQEVNESQDTCPLGLLTPPSPPSAAPPSTPQQEVVATGEGRPTAMDTVCDGSGKHQTASTPMVSATRSAPVTTTPPIMVSTGGTARLSTAPANTAVSSANACQVAAPGGVRQLSTEGNPVPNANNNNNNLNYQSPRYPPHPSAPPHHHQLPPHHGNISPQQYMQLGVHLNGNGIGNGSTYPNPQMLPFHHQGSQNTPEQQQSSQMMNMNINSPLQNQSCYMQNAACKDFQHNSQPLNAQRVQGHVDSMTGPLSSVPSNQNHIPPRNHSKDNIVFIRTTNGLTIKRLIASDPQPAQTSSRPTSLTSSRPTSLTSSRPTSLTSSRPASRTSSRPASLPDSTGFPRDLDILWREVPPDYQKLFDPIQDVPKSAKLRGFFTVRELLDLKRTLKGRYRETLNMNSLLSSTPAQQVPLTKIDGDGIGMEDPLNKMAVVSEPNGKANDNGGQLRGNDINKIAATINHAENPINVNARDSSNSV